MDPNPYEVTEPELLRGLRLSGGAVSSRTTPVSRSVLIPFVSVSGSCRFLPCPTGCQGFRPQSLRAPAFFSTLGSLHNRGLSNGLIPDTLTLPSDTADGSSKSAATERNHSCTRPVPCPRHRGRRWPPDQALYLPFLRRHDRLLQDRFTGQNAYCTPFGSSHNNGPPGPEDSSPLIS